MYENRVLRRIFGLKRDAVTWHWRRLHNKELYDLYCSPKYYSGDQIKKNEMGVACGIREVRTGFWWGDLRERDNL